MRIDVFFIRSLGVETAVKLKRCMTGTDVFYIIVSKFGHRKKLGQIILFVIDKNLKIDLHCIILFLGLAISLKMKSSRKLSFDPKKVAEQ